VLDRPAIYRHFQKRQAKLTLYSNFLKKLWVHKGAHKAISIGEQLQKIPNRLIHDPRIVDCSK
jgi:hypothetical protein